MGVPRRNFSADFHARREIKRAGEAAVDRAEQHLFPWQVHSQKGGSQSYLKRAVHDAALIVAGARVIGIDVKRVVIAGQSREAENVLLVNLKLVSDFQTRAQVVG